MKFKTIEEVNSFVYESVLESLRKVEGQKQPRFYRMSLGETKMVVINFKLESNNHDIPEN